MSHSPCVFSFSIPVFPPPKPYISFLQVTPFHNVSRLLGIPSSLLTGMNEEVNMHSLLEKACEHLNQTSIWAGIYFQEHFFPSLEGLFPLSVHVYGLRNSCKSRGRKHWYNPFIWMPQDPWMEPVFLAPTGTVRNQVIGTFRACVQGISEHHEKN